MHLKCRKHDSRVVVLQTKTIHRSDGSECDSPRVVINGNAYTPESIRENVHQTKGSESWLKELKE